MTKAPDRLPGSGGRRRVIAAAAAICVGALDLLVLDRAAAVVFVNTTPVVVGNPSPGIFVTPASPYPSNIVVSGLTGTVTDVNVTLCGLSATFPSDVDLLLVAPGGTTGAIIMSDAGGTNETNTPVTNVSLTLDDQAANQLPADNVLTTGASYRPLDDDADTGELVPIDTFPLPAPAPGGKVLSFFNGIAPNGTWNLYMVDDFPGTPATGELVLPQLSCGWSIDILTAGGGTSTSMSSTSSTTSTSSTSTSSTSTSSTSTSSTSTSTTSTSTTTTSTTSTSTTSTTLPATCERQAATIVGTGASETIIGTAGNDVIVARGGDDIVYGGGGADRICGGEGVDRIFGEDGDDRLFGGAGADVLDGGAGGDALFGEAGVDRLLGGPGNDALDGGPDYDNCLGQDGQDTASACEGIVSVP
jgi:Ca2+-binding RTX toxin-like protein